MKADTPVSSARHEAFSGTKLFTWVLKNYDWATVAEKSHTSAKSSASWAMAGNLITTEIMVDVFEGDKNGLVAISGSFISVKM